MHVYASLEGFGVRVVPQVPFRITREHSAPGCLGVEWTRQDGSVATARVVPAEGRCRLEPGEGAADLLPLPGSPRAWRIATSRFSMAWPEGTALQSSPTPESPPGFDLTAPGDVLLWPQGIFPAAKVGIPERLAAPGQRLLRSGRRGTVSFVELGYEHDGEPWRQRHDLVEVTPEYWLVLTVQAPEANWLFAERLANEVADSARAT